MCGRIYVCLISRDWQERHELVTPAAFETNLGLAVKTSAV